MKSAMKRSFGQNRHSTQNNSRSAACAIKQESAMYTEYRRPKELRNSKMKGMNPLNKFGNLVKYVKVYFTGGRNVLTMPLW